MLTWKHLLVVFVFFDVQKNLIRFYYNLFSKAVKNFEVSQQSMQQNKITVFYNKKWPSTKDLPLSQYVTSPD